MTKEPLVWSPLPRESYTIVWEGRLYGIGLHPGMGHPGAWNLLWLTSRLIDDLLEWERPAAQFPYSITTLPLCVGSALQSYTDLMTVGELAESVAPDLFLEKIRVMPDPIILASIYGRAWWEAATERAQLYRRLNDNVIRADFRRKQ